MVTRLLSAVQVAAEFFAMGAGERPDERAGNKTNGRAIFRP
jgi:hypothetical protein